MKISRINDGVMVEHNGRRHARLAARWDDLFLAANPAVVARQWFEEGHPVGHDDRILAPIVSQEVWAAGVTYERSKSARMAEAKRPAGAEFYDHVYQAPRPEIFFKATPHRVSGPGEPVRVRGDSNWSVPEPELTLAVNSFGSIFGYTIGNDLSARDIEGENPLYLPQAKVWTKSAALGPCILIDNEPLPPSTSISLNIARDGKTVFADSTTLAQLRRSPQLLVDYLLRENNFPAGCYLMTGTCIVPPDEFTLRSGDVIRITIEPIGVLSNTVV
jgi:2-dehydro-3-deoxy-D-arabinonate dehydratase